MKKSAILLFAIVAMFSVQSAKAWHNFAHGTIAYIAEQHLTPEAKEKCHYYLRHTLPFYASWMDQWRNVAKFARANSNHSGMAMADGVNYDMTSGSIPGRVMGHLVNALAELGDGKYKELPDSVVRQRLVNMAHYVGDMHCPSHANFPKENFPHYSYQLLEKGKPYKFHTFWDKSLGLKKRIKWSYEKITASIDTITPEQAQKLQSGSLEDWGREIIQFGHRARKITPAGTDISKMSKEQINEAVALSNEAAIAGGYRLAYVLNTIFSDKNIPVYSK